MARRKANPRALKEARRDPPPELLGPVRLVSVGGRKFVTLGPDAVAWEHGAAGVFPVASGTFVRLRPPSHAEDSRIAEVKAELEAHGAVVKVEPREASEAVLAAEVDVPETADKPRDVVLALIEASNCDDKPTLRAICEKVMDRCGL